MPVENQCLFGFGFSEVIYTALLTELIDLNGTVVYKQGDPTEPRVFERLRESDWG